MSAYVTLRHSMTKIHVVIEEPEIRIRPGHDGERYATAELTLDQAKNLHEDLTRRIADLERSA